MTAKTRIGIICDMHLPDNKVSPQYAFLQRAAERMKQDGVNIVICLGDITSYGEIGAWELYCETWKDFRHYEVAGNSDVRDALNRTELLNAISEAKFSIGSRRVIGINTPDGEISAKDRERLKGVKAGDIVFMHHYIQSMKPESGEWLKELAERIPLIILHGHGHKKFDHYLGNTHVMGLRPLDPDKSFGDFPCINYLDVSDEDVSVTEVILPLPKGYLEEVGRYFGLSCVDNEKDVTYAIEHSIKYVELRCNGSDWKPDMSLLPKLETWRKKTNGYLSVHMPNLHYKEGVISGKEQWMEAIDYAITVGAESLTIHPPRISIADMQENSEAWCELLELYVLVAKCIPRETRIGIENLHKGKKEKLDEYRKFGYIPEEITAWIDAINDKLGEERVGHVLDVGHARNNGAFAQKYTSSKWYHMMGKKTIAYHIHQVLPTANGIKNHNAIENWFGPEINYTSFFYAWHHNMLNHVPVFLEVKGSENFEKSIAAFKVLEKYCDMWE